MECPSWEEVGLKRGFHSLGLHDPVTTFAEPLRLASSCIQWNAVRRCETLHTAFLSARSSQGPIQGNSKLVENGQLINFPSLTQIIHSASLLALQT